MYLDDRTKIHAIRALLQDMTDKELFDDLMERAKVFLSISRIIKADDYSGVIQVFIDRGWSTNKFATWVRINPIGAIDASGLLAECLNFPEWIKG